LCNLRFQWAFLSGFVVWPKTQTIKPSTLDNEETIVFQGYPVVHLIDFCMYVSISRTSGNAGRYTEKESENFAQTNAVVVFNRTHLKQFLRANPPKRKFPSTSAIHEARRSKNLKNQYLPQKNWKIQKLVNRLVLEDFKFEN